MNLDELLSSRVLEDLTDQQKRALAWEIIDKHAPSRGFSRKKLVPLHGTIVSMLTASGPGENTVDNIRKVLSDT